MARTAAALLAAACTVPAAGCELPDSAALLADDKAVTAAKFSLIERHCGGIARQEPAAAPPRAAQLDLYATGYRSGSLSVPARVDAPRTLPAAPALAPAPAPRSVRAGAGRILALAPTLHAAAQRHDIDPLLLHAIAHVESRHNAAAVSPAGARGVMQVMPATARRFGVADPQRELMEPSRNVDVSAALLKTLQARFGNDLSLVLAAYNAGEGAVQRHGNRVPNYPETRDYVKQVLRAYEALRSAVVAAAP